MQDLKSLLTEITEFTNTLESDYPELYRNLDENPMTLPKSEHPELNKRVFQDYLESLKQLLEHYLETRKNN